MDLVKNQKTKAIAVAVHVHIRTVVSRYSEIFKLVIAPTQDAYIAGKGVSEQVVPLIHKINRGRGQQEYCGQSLQYPSVPEETCPIPWAGQRHRDIGVTARRQRLRPDADVGCVRG